MHGLLERHHQLVATTSSSAARSHTVGSLRDPVKFLAALAAAELGGAALEEGTDAFFGVLG